MSKQQSRARLCAQGCTPCAGPPNVIRQPARRREEINEPALRAGCRLSLLALGVLGIVYGDIGTIPLCAFRNCFGGHTELIVSSANVLGVLSLIFWSLLIVITLKHFVFIMRADNYGEGFVRIIVHQGFMEQLNVPSILKQAEDAGIEYDPMKSTSLLGRVTLIPAGKQMTR